MTTTAAPPTSTGTYSSPVGVEHDRPVRIIPHSQITDAVASAPSGIQLLSIPSTTWVLSQDAQYGQGYWYTADCGPYLGPWPIMIPFPQNVPIADASEVDYVVSTSPLAAMVDNSYQNDNNHPYYQVSCGLGSNGLFYRGDWFGGGGGTGGTIDGQHAPPPGTHLYVIWMPLGYNGTKTDPPPNPPSYDALTLVPANYANGGSATTPAFDTYTPLGYLGTPSQGVILSRTTYATVTYPSRDQGNWLTEGVFGQPAIGILPDKSIVVAAPWFYQSAGTVDAPVEGGNDNNIKIQVWHLAPDLSVLGELLVHGYTTSTGTTPDTWGGWANCLLAVNRSTEPGKVLLVTYNRRYDTSTSPDTFARSHSWVLDCSGAAPVIASTSGVPRYESKSGHADWNGQAIGFPQHDLGNGTALVTHNTQNGIRVVLYNWSTGQVTVRFDGVTEVAFEVNAAGQPYYSGTDNPIAVYFDPNNPDSVFAVVCASGEVHWLTRSSNGWFVDGGATSPYYAYYVIGAGNPFEDGAQFVDQVSDQWDIDGQFSALHATSGDKGNAAQDNHNPNFYDPGPADFVATGPFEWNTWEQGVNYSGTWNSARVGPQLYVASDQLYRDPTETGNLGAFVRLYLIEHSAGVKTDIAELTFPAPIAPLTCSAAIAGSDAIDATADTIAAACFILDQYSNTGSPIINPTLVVWTTPVASPPPPPGEPMAATAHIYRVIQDGAGNIVIGAQVSFCNPGTDVTITDQLYADETLQTKLDNPFISLDGIIDVYLAAPRTVSVRTLYGGQLQVADYLDVLSNAENILAAQGPVTIDNDAFTGGVLQMVGTDTAEWTDPSQLVGGVESVQQGTHIQVDNSDPENPVINATGLIETVQPGLGITVDATNPARPIVIATPAKVLRSATFFTPGVLALATGAAKWLVPDTCTIQEVDLTLGTLPDAGGVTIDVKVWRWNPAAAISGGWDPPVTIFTNPGGWPRITAGGLGFAKWAPAITSLNAQDALTVDVIEVGSGGVPGSDLTVQVVYF